MKRWTLTLALVAVVAALAWWGSPRLAREGAVESQAWRPSAGYDGPSAAMAIGGYQLQNVVVTSHDSTRWLSHVRPDSSLLIRDGSVRLQIDSLEPALARVRELVDRLGGYVGETSTHMGRGAVRSASIALKVPARRFDEALAGVRPIGEVEAVSVSTEDVSEEYVDVGARMENARRLERRLVQILANRTGALKDVLEVEQALARVREEIERYEGRLRYLREHAAMSSLEVSLHEPAPLMGHAGSSVLGAAFDRAWDNFVSLTVVLVQALGFIVPALILTTVAWLAVRRFRHASQPAA